MNCGRKTAPARTDKGKRFLRADLNIHSRISRTNSTNRRREMQQDIANFLVSVLSAHCSVLLLIHPQILDQKRPLIGSFFDQFGGGLARSMAGSRFDSDQDRRGTGLTFLQSSCKLETV